MTPERRAEWEAKRLLAAVENAVHKAETGRWEDAVEALIRVEGIAIQARSAASAAVVEEVYRGNRVG